MSTNLTWRFGYAKDVTAAEGTSCGGPSFGDVQHRVCFQSLSEQTHHDSQHVFVVQSWVVQRSAHQSRDLFLAVKIEELHGVNHALAATDAILLLFRHDEIGEVNRVHHLIRNNAHVGRCYPGRTQPPTFRYPGLVKKYVASYDAQRSTARRYDARRRSPVACGCCGHGRLATDFRSGGETRCRADHAAKPVNLTRRGLSGHDPRGRRDVWAG